MSDALPIDVDGPDLKRDCHCHCHHVRNLCCVRCQQSVCHDCTPLWEAAAPIQPHAPTRGFTRCCVFSRGGETLTASNSTDSQSCMPLLKQWSTADVAALFDLPFLDLLFRAQQVHREHHVAGAVQKAQLLSIKTGHCSEDCSYCPQSARYDTGLEPEKLMPVDEVLAEARRAKDDGASRYCLGAAWRSPKDKDVDVICEMISGIKAMGMEACVTLGMLTDGQAQKLKAAGLDYYNHNIDTSPEYYPEVITTRTFEDRLNTLDSVRKAEINVCCGGIVGMGESRLDRSRMIEVLGNMAPPPESVPINSLVKVKGTPLSLKQVDDEDAVDGIELVKTIAVARIVMPQTTLRLSAGRESMSDELQAVCFMAGAGSVFWGDKLLTTKNNGVGRDERLFQKLGLTTAAPADPALRAIPSPAAPALLPDGLAGEGDQRRAASTP